MLPPNEIQSAGELGPWKDHGRQAGGMKTQKNSQATAARGRMFVRTPFIRQIHDSKARCEAADDRGKEVSDHKPRQKHRDIFAEKAEHTMCDFRNGLRIPALTLIAAATPLWRNGLPVTRNAHRCAETWFSSIPKRAG